MADKVEIGRSGDEESVVRRQRRRPLIGSQIRRLRTERGLTLARMAESTGLNIGYLSKIETDKASPSLETLAALGEVMDVPMSWLLTESVPPPKVVRHADRHLYPGRGRNSFGERGRVASENDAHH